MENKNITDAVKESYSSYQGRKIAVKSAGRAVDRARAQLTSAVRLFESAEKASEGAFETLKQVSADWVLGQLAPPDPPF
jgi:hypothetical protein